MAAAQAEVRQQAKCVCFLLLEAVLKPPAFSAGSENQNHLDETHRRAEDRYQWLEKENKCFHWGELPC